MPCGFVRCGFLCCVAWVWLAICIQGRADAEQLFQLRNGLILQGTKIEIASLKEGFAAAAAQANVVRPVWLIDDGLRSQYVHGRSMVAADPVEVAGLGSTIQFWQPRATSGKAVGGLGTILGISAFNKTGRRKLTMRGPKGSLNIIQGITEINPRYAKLEALKQKPNLLWDMRVATSSIDSETLSMIFQHRVDENDLNARLELVRFFKDAGRFGKAQEALRDTMEDFPEEKELPPLLISLAERQGAQLIDEAKHRIAARQRGLAMSILKRFPLDQVGRVQRIEVSETIEGLETADQDAARLAKQLAAQVQSLGDIQAAELKPAVDEISAGLSAETAIRLSDYKRLGNADNLPVENRVALALTGWLLGPGKGEQNLNVAISLYSVRNVVREYLSGIAPGRRAALLEKLKNLEGATPEFIDRMLPYIVPAQSFPAESAAPDTPGLFRVVVDEIDYHVQLPPEYDPLVSYPCVLALGVAGGDSLGSIHWWCGDVAPADPSALAFHQSDVDRDSASTSPVPLVANHRAPLVANRLGHAARNGFVVVAPVWSRPTQRKYEYTALEHHRVLAALRDAMRRVSIDADRVFLAGHGEGGTAAWDIGLAHPDVWAGMISVSGTPDKTVHHYELNARYLPKYLVMGKLDGDRADGAIMDDYMGFRHDALVVMYRGRGREFFYDEVPRLFEWMQSKSNVRREIPDEISVATMREGDQFFWWLELIDLNAQVKIDPILWHQAERIRAGKVEASIGQGNQIRFDGPCDAFEIWLRPTRSVDLNKPIKLKHGSRTKTVEFDGGIETLLEDVRTRADRQRPFWMRIGYP